MAYFSCWSQLSDICRKNGEFILVHHFVSLGLLSFIEYMYLIHWDYEWWRMSILECAILMTWDLIYLGVFKYYSLVFYGLFTCLTKKYKLEAVILLEPWFYEMLKLHSTSTPNKQSTTINIRKSAQGCSHPYPWMK